MEIKAGDTVNLVRNDAIYSTQHDLVFEMAMENNPYIITFINNSYCVLDGLDDVWNNHFIEKTQLREPDWEV